MKRLLCILLLIPVLGFSQYTAIPDQNFEQALIDLGFDDILDGVVLTNNINNITILNLSQLYISDLTGIEGFVSLQELDCSLNLLQNLDVSQNINLSLLNCVHNQITSLDLSNNVMLSVLASESNQLSCLNLKNGNNINMSSNWFSAADNPNLNCIEVDDPNWATNNWTTANYNIDAGTTFSTNCNYPAGCF